MNWNSFLHSGSFRGGLCALLIAAILLGLWLPGSGLKAAEPENPLADEGIREITVLKMGENVSRLDSAEPEDGGQTTPAQGNTPNTETKPEDTRKEPEKTSDDTGSDGQEEGNQGADGGETSQQDLAMSLTWNPRAAAGQTVICSPDETVSVPVQSSEITEGLFRFSVKLTETQEKNAEIIGGAYTTDSDPGAKELDFPDGTLILAARTESKKETYHLTFTVKTKDKEVLFRYDVVYRQIPDVTLSFTWLENGRKERKIECRPEGSASDKVRNNQLSAGSLTYRMEPTGDDAGSAQFMSASYTSDAGDGARIGKSGSIPMKLPAGASSNTYRITAVYLVSGQKLTYEILLRYGYDVTLQLEYTLQDSGRMLMTCENTKTKTAATVYDNQLIDDMLDYELSLIGEDAGSITIRSVTFSSNAGRPITPGLSGQVKLQLMNGKPGQNVFYVTAQDNDENPYTFTINIPYKHKGVNNILITTNLDNVTEIPNEATTNLTVQARSEKTGYLPAAGTDTILRVVFDGVELKDPLGSGNTWEYSLYPANPETGDENTHTLRIYAEDAYGNYGEKELTFTGFRRQAGEKIGNAAIYVDMTVLGIGVVGPISYDVLADEPISYVVTKAVMGQDTGEPFGAAKSTFGFAGSHAGTLNDGFYLQSLNTGYTADALEGNNWPGTTEDEVLEAIDARFGKGTGLATLWRCLYRNGLNKSTGSGGTFGEFDYTSGSGWMYSVGGAAYYPGQSMSAVYLKDGDVLTLRYTLAYGWDVGGGSEGYGNTVGYCVTATNGSFYISHQMETMERPDGSVYYVCHCCGLIEDCAHENTIYKDLEDGTHVLFCQECQTAISDPQPHSWTHEGEGTEEKHICTECGASEAHFWREVEGTNTATCTDPGVRTVRCDVCAAEREEEVPPKGHTLDNRWNYTAAEHYQKCSTCGEEVNRSAHQYVYDEEWDDYVCSVCNVLHDWDTGCTGTLTIREATCQRILYHCDGCGNDLARYGSFEEYHDYENGVCRYCGTEDPNYTPHEHDYHETERVEPTCTEPGYILYVCECGDSYSQTLSATGHVWGEWTVVKEPTAEEPGERTRYCENCGETESETIDPIAQEPQMHFLTRLFRAFL